MESSKNKWRPRMTLANLLLLVTALATAFASYRTEQQLELARAAVASSRALARELTIEDRTKIAAITRMPTIPRELIFDVFIPRSAGGHGSHELALVLEGIVRHGQTAARFPEPDQTHPIAPGQHVIEIRHEEPESSDNPDQEHQIQILLDGETVMAATRPREWMPSNGWTANSLITETEFFDPTEPAELYRRRFNTPSASGSTSVPWKQPANGILLWIQPQARPPRAERP